LPLVAAGLSLSLHNLRDPLAQSLSQLLSTASLRTLCTSGLLGFSTDPEGVTRSRLAGVGVASVGLARSVQSLWGTTCGSELLS